jgi:RimJ/RimL family protein N-acetyltransferase
MYEHLFFTLFPTHHLFTRTWSTNAAHIAILGKFGFSQIARIENDRGEGIDTVYFAKKRS